MRKNKKNEREEIEEEVKGRRMIWKKMNKKNYQEEN